MDESYWQHQREKVLMDPDVVNLNAGSFSPLRIGVFDRVTQLRRELATTPCNFHWRRTPVLLNAARGALAAELSVNPENLLLLPNATFGINLVTNSLRLPAGSEILTTDHEYGAMLSCWRRMTQRDGSHLRVVPLPHRLDDPEEVVNLLRAAIGPQTRVLFVSHVTSPTGVVLPVQRLCAVAKEQGIVSVVDGAHAPGMFPLDLSTLGADYYAGNCHKWLMAPAGAGFLHVGPNDKSLEPLITSWGWDYPDKFAEEDSGWGGSFWARNLEFHGTVDRCPLFVLPEVLADRAAIGVEEIDERTRFLSTYARSRLTDLGFQPVATARLEQPSAMVAFETPPVEPVSARDWLWHQHRIEAPFTTVGSRSFLRISTAWFNTIAEIDRLADVMAIFPFGHLT